MRKVYFAILALIISLGFAIPLQAQDACGVDLQIFNETEHQLNRAAICESAQSFIERDFLVYVFLTDDSAPTEDGWFAVRDRLESTAGIYDPAQNTFRVDVVSIEMSTNTSYPHGQDLAIGEWLFGTHLDSDQAIAGIEHQLRSDVAAGNYTLAVTRALVSAYTIAYPPVVVVQPTAIPNTAIPTAVAQATQVQQPTNAVQPTIAVQQPAVSESAGSSVLGVIANLALAGVIICFTLIGVLLLVHDYLKLRGLRLQLNRTRQVVKAIFMDVETLLREGILEGRIEISDANKDEAMLQAIEERLQEAKSGHDAAGRALDVIEARESEYHWLRFWQSGILNQLIQDWELIYITLSGKNDRILRLSEEDARKFFDPFAEIATAERGVLESQVEPILRANDRDYFQIEVSVIATENMDPDGVLGHLFVIKQTIEALDKARAEVPGKIAGLHAELEQWKTGLKIVDPALTADVLSAYATTLLAEAQAHLDGERWLKAADLLDDIQAVMREVTETVADLEAQLGRTNEMRAHIESIRSQGFTLAEADKTLGEEQTIKNQIVNAYQLGDLDHVDELAGTLTALYEKAAEQADSQNRLMQSNTKQLEKLQQRIAEVDQLRATGEADMETLRDGYPESNLEGLDNIDFSGLELEKARENAVKIAGLNSMEQQQFAEADTLLDASFAQLTSAETAFRQSTTRLALVQRLETVLNQELEEIQRDLGMIREMFSANSNWIDDELEDLLPKLTRRFAEAEGLIANREFFTGQRELGEIDELVDTAYSRSKDQVTRTENLFTQVRKLRSELEQLVTQAQREYNALPDPAKLEKTKQHLDRVITDFNRIVGDKVVNNATDANLRKMLEEVVDRYERMIAEVEDLLEEIEEDGTDYQNLVKQTNAKIRSAAELIEDAQKYVTDSDSGESGDTAYQLAVNSLPNIVNTTLSIIQLRNLMNQAEQAEEHAETARREARARISQVETARAEAERQARLERQRRQQSWSYTSTSNDDDDDDNSIYGNSTPGINIGFGSNNIGGNSMMGSMSRSRNLSTGSAIRSHSPSMGSSRRR